MGFNNNPTHVIIEGVFIFTVFFHVNKTIHKIEDNFKSREDSSAQCAVSVYFFIILTIGLIIRKSCNHMVKLKFIQIQQFYSCNLTDYIAAKTTAKVASDFIIWYMDITT